MRGTYIVLLEGCGSKTNLKLHQPTLKILKLYFATIGKSTEMAELWSV